MIAHIAVFGDTMVFFMSGNSCQTRGSSTGFFGSGDAHEPRYVSLAGVQD